MWMIRVRFLPRLVAALIPFGSGAMTMQPNQTDSTVRFPPVEGRTLEGRTMRLPGDFEGEVNVVLVAFQREQQRDVDSWMPFLHRLAAAHTTLRVYELPTLGREYRLMRSFIDGGMRRGIPDRAVRAATITLYLDKSRFRRALELPDEERIYVLLVGRDGAVQWRAEGAFDGARAEELERLLTVARVPTGE